MSALLAVRKMASKQGYARQGPRLQQTGKDLEEQSVYHQEQDQNFKSNVISVELYGGESWRMAQTDEKKLDAFLLKRIRRILKIYWPMCTTNDEIRRRTGKETISSQIARKRWAWLGHFLRMDHNSHPGTALTWVPEGKRKRGRPREIWRRTVERELKARDIRTWAEAASAAADRIAWRESACSPILSIRSTDNTYIHDLNLSLDLMYL